MANWLPIFQKNRQAPVFSPPLGAALPSSACTKSAPGGSKSSRSPFRDTVTTRCMRRVYTTLSKIGIELKRMLACLSRRSREVVIGCQLPVGPACDLFTSKKV